jgi:queuine tRNA-ribosyltransferase
MLFFSFVEKHLFDAGFKLTYLCPPNNRSKNGIMKFDLLKDPQSKARAGSITTDHGVIETPILCLWVL